MFPQPTLPESPPSPSDPYSGCPGARPSSLGLVDNGPFAGQARACAPAVWAVAEASTEGCLWLDQVTARNRSRQGQLLRAPPWPLPRLPFVKLGRGDLRQDSQSILRFRGESGPQLLVPSLIFAGVLHMSLGWRPSSVGLAGWEDSPSWPPYWAALKPMIWGFPRLSSGLCPHVPALRDRPCTGW